MLKINELIDEIDAMHQGNKENMLRLKEAHEDDMND